MDYEKWGKERKYRERKSREELCIEDWRLSKWEENIAKLHERRSKKRYRSGVLADQNDTMINDKGNINV